MRTTTDPFDALLIFAAALSVLCFGPISLGAETYLVTDSRDDNGSCTVNDCTLREAVIAANSSTGPDIIFLPSGVYLLSILGAEEQMSLTGDLDITDDIEIIGISPGSVTIVGDGSDRVMTIFSSTVRLSNLIITGGDVPAQGGGIWMLLSDVTIERVSIVGNKAANDGGGISQALGQLTLNHCTISSNLAARYGGGISRIGGVPGLGADLTLINTTVSNNSAVTGAGIYSERGGLFSIVNSTVAHNIATEELGSSVLAAQQQDYSWTNSVIIGRCGFRNAFAPDSNGGNLESPGNSCEFSHPSDQVNIPDPGLGPLRDNGGPTRTHALLAGSPAIDRALDANCPPTDQRGLERPFDGDGDGTATCDSGAVEFVSAYDVEIPTLDRVGLGVLTILLASVAVRTVIARRIRIG